MKKGEVNFNQNKIDTLKNEVKDLDEQLPIFRSGWRAPATSVGRRPGAENETVLTTLRLPGDGVQLAGRSEGLLYEA